MAIDPAQLRLLLAQQQAANAPAPQTVGGNGIDQIVNPQQDVQPQSKPGPIKSFLSNFLYGAGQGMLAHQGLETDAQKQQRLANQQIAQQNAETLASLRGAQTSLAASKANTFNAKEFGAKLGLDFPDQDLPVSEMAKLFAPYVRGQATENASQNTADARVLAARLAADAANNRTNQMFAPLSPYGSKIAHTGGQDTLIDRYGNPIKKLGVSNAMLIPELRARTQAEYRTVPSTDDEGNPINISGLTSLQTGSPTVPFAQARNLVSDLTGVNQYEHIITDKISPNLNVLNDNAQRMAIAHTLEQAEKNPGAIQSIITSQLQAHTLTPEGAKLAAGILQGIEFGPVARKYGGNMNGTEGLAARIKANQTSPLNIESLNRELIANDLEFTKKAKSSIVGLTKRGVPAGKTPANAPSAPSNLPSWDRGPVK